MYIDINIYIYVFKHFYFVLVPPDAAEEHHWRADCSVSPGALCRHQLCCVGDQGL